MSAIHSAFCAYSRLNAQKWSDKILGQIYGKIESILLSRKHEIMTELLEKAIAELTRLPDDQQNTMAQLILEELEDEARWDAAFDNSLPQLEKLANKALEDYLKKGT